MFELRYPWNQASIFQEFKFVFMMKEEVNEANLAQVNFIDHFLWDSNSH